MKTKLLVLILALLMLSSLTACNFGSSELPTESPTDTPTEEVTEPTCRLPDEKDPYMDHVTDKTYGGADFTVLCRPDGNFSKGLLVLNTDRTSTAVDRAVYERTAFLAEQFDIRFVWDFAADYKTDLTTKAEQYTKTGANNVELISAQAGEVAWDLAIGDMLYDWNGIEILQTDRDYWSRNAAEQFSTPGGKLFFMTGDANHNALGSATCLFFDKELVESVPGLGSLYDLVFEDRWTFEKFSELVTVLHSKVNDDGSNTLQTDGWGYVTSYTTGYHQALLSTKYSLVEKNDNPSAIYGYKVNITKEIFDKLIDDCRELYRSGTTYASRTESVAMLRQAFLAGRAAFYDDEVDFAATLQTYGIRFGILPWPKYDEDTFYYKSLVSQSIDVYGIAANTTEEQAELVASVLEMMAHLGRQDILPAYRQSLLTLHYLKDEESMEMLEYIHKGLTYDFAYLYNPGGVMEYLADAILKPGTSIFPEETSGFESAFKEDLQKWVSLDEA